MARFCEFEQLDTGMDQFLEELEALEITNDFSEEGLWSACIDLIQRSILPKKTAAASRPYEEKDFRKHKQVVERNLRNVRSTLQLILHSRNEGNSQLDCNTPIVRNFTTNLLLLIGEQHEKNVWNTVESVSISKDLANGLLELYGCQSISQILFQLDKFLTVLLALRPKLLKETWKCYPAAVACYKWLLYEVEKPALSNHISDVLPTALIIADDFVPENVLIGLQCLQRIMEHCHMKKGLIDTGYDKVIFYVLEPLMYRANPRYVAPLYACIASLLDTVEHWDNNSNVFEWTQRDSVLSTFLNIMGSEQDVELRHEYMLSLPQLLTNIGCAKWCQPLAEILADYCENQTNLRTLKATLETTKVFLLMFHLRVGKQCAALYRALLKLHYDLSKTRLFDKEIMQNLEDCICLLYKLSPNVGCTIVHDGRLRLVVKNTLQVMCIGDTKYFE